MKREQVFEENVALAVKEKKNFIALVLYKIFLKFSFRD